MGEREDGSGGGGTEGGLRAQRRPLHSVDGVAARWLQAPWCGEEPRPSKLLTTSNRLFNKLFSTLWCGIGCRS